MQKSREPEEPNRLQIVCLKPTIVLEANANVENHVNASAGEERRSRAEQSRLITAVMSYSVFMEDCQTTTVLAVQVTIASACTGNATGSFSHSANV